MVTVDRQRLAVLPSMLVLLLFCASWPPAGASPTWDDPFYTADTSDQYIKDIDESNSVITLYEDVPIGHKIGVLHMKAQPGDTVTVSQGSANDEVQLSFDGTSNTERNVYIQSVIDREKTDSINVAISLNGGSTNYLIIQVADVNDNTPTFDGGQGSQISLDVEEEYVLSDPLLTLTATDADIDATRTLTYSMDTGGYDYAFTLIEVTVGGKPGCELRLLKALDYEIRPLYKLTIAVTDAPDDRGKTLSSSVVVFVNVLDIGDNAPRWLVPPMASSIDENNKQDTELFTVLAIDGDTSVNSNVSYSIISQFPEGFVQMTDPRTGQVTLKKDLNREDPDLEDGGFISIVVQAKEDPEGDPCTDITCVNGTALITVNDLDDNAPEFDQSSYSVSFPENTTGAINLLISAIDTDATAPHNLMTASLVSAPEGVFELRNSRGAGYMTTYLVVMDRDYMDYESETRRHIPLTIMVTGDGSGAVSTTADVTIAVDDIDDSSPRWDRPFMTADTADYYIRDCDVTQSVLSVYEDVPIGHKIATLHIVSQSGEDVAVRQSSGVEDIQLSFSGTNTRQDVFIQSSIDREKTDSISVGVQLNGGSTNFFTIQVADVNDNVPTFDGVPGYQISVQMPENQLNDSLLILTATDQDVGATDSLTYTMDTGGYDDRFALNMLKKDGKPACQLQVTKELDYETMPMYRLLVTVQDAPDDRGLVLNSTLRVFVNVEDREDSPPRWLLPARTV